VSIGEKNQFGFEDEFGSNDQLGQDNQFGESEYCLLLLNYVLYNVPSLACLSEFVEGFLLVFELCYYRGDKRDLTEVKKTHNGLLSAYLSAFLRALSLFP
jgi:hypothetical protein